MPGPDVTSTFARRLAILVLVGLAVRVGYVLLIAGERDIIGDAFNYHNWAKQIAAGNGMVTVSHPQIGFIVTDPEPTADLGPLFPFFLAAVTKVGISSILGHKLVMAVVGTITVAVLGLAGREAAGERVGLLAAGLAAVYPFLWVVDGALMSESLYGVWLSLLLWLAIRFGRDPSVMKSAVLGALVAIAALTRGEALGLAILLIVPLAWVAGTDLAQRARMIGAAALVAVVVLTPWTVRNVNAFDAPVLISNNANGVFAGANCDEVYQGEYIGLWSFECYGERPDGDEAERAAVYRNRGLSYARDHVERLPVVVAVRFARVWEAYRPIHQTEFLAFEGRPRSISMMGLAVYYPIALFAVVGLVRIRRDLRLLIPLLAPLVLVSLVAMGLYGFTRFRFSAEPALVVLAALGIDHLIRRRAGRRVPDTTPAPL